MESLRTILIVVDVLSALAVIGLILLQQGKGASVGAAFGAGASGTVFGASGSANFLSRTTAVLITIFFVCSLGLSYISLHYRDSASGSTILDRIDTTPSANQGTTPSQIPALLDPVKDTPVDKTDTAIDDAVQQIPKQ